MCCPEGMRTVVNYHSECPNTDCVRGMEEMAWRQLTTIVARVLMGKSRFRSLMWGEQCVCVCVGGGGGGEGGNSVGNVMCGECDVWGTV